MRKFFLENTKTTVKASSWIRKWSLISKPSIWVIDLGNKFQKQKENRVGKAGIMLWCFPLAENHAAFPGLSSQPYKYLPQIEKSMPKFSPYKLISVWTQVTLTLLHF